MNHHSIVKPALKGVLSAFFAGITAFACLTMSPAVTAQTATSDAAKPARLVIQVSDAEPAKWNLALNNAKNVQDELGEKNVEIEIVAYGPGIGMLKMDSVANSRVEAAGKAGIKVVACENTMRNQKLTRSDMHPAIGYVNAGVVEIMQKQAAGWAYVRP
jgi:uncharacterized protein